MNPEFPELCTAKSGHCAHTTPFGRYRYVRDEKVWSPTRVCCHCGARGMITEEGMHWHGQYLPLGVAQK